MNYNDQPTMLYRFFDSKLDLLYVGISSIGPGRWKEHSKTKPWWHEIRSSTVEHFENRRIALDAEKNAIKNENPKYNKLHNSISKEIRHVDVDQSNDENSLCRECQDDDYFREITFFVSHQIPTMHLHVDMPVWFSFLDVLGYREVFYEILRLNPGESNVYIRFHNCEQVVLIEGGFDAYGLAWDFEDFFEKLNESGGNNKFSIVEQDLEEIWFKDPAIPIKNEKECICDV
jgi:hypothetical protein